MTLRIGPHPLSVLTLCFGVAAAGCGRSAVSPSPPTPSTTGVVQGVVSFLGSPLEGVLVEVLDGAVPGHSTTTDAAGKYRLELPVGPTRLRFSGYTSTESAITISSEPLTLDQSFNAGHWMVRGLVTNHDGVPLAQIGLYLVDSSGRGALAGHATTDQAGRFAIVTTAPARSGSVNVEQQNPYVNQSVPFVCGGSVTELATGLCDGKSEVIVPVTLTRILSVTLLGPTSVRVGQEAEIRRQVFLDDGTTVEDNSYEDFRLTTASETHTIDQGIARVFGGAVVGVAPGTTTLATSIYNINASLTVHVER